MCELNAQDPFLKGPRKNKGPSGLELANLNAGMALRVSDAKGSPLASLGLRLDSWLNRIGAASPWLKAHASVAKLPLVEFGPALMWFGPTHRWIFGANVSVKFGK